MYAASSDARKATAFAMSSGLPKCPSGICAADAFFTSSDNTAVISVSINAGQANYAASKAGIIGMTKSAARELASRGVTVNAVAPGFIETEMTAVLSEEVKKASAAQIPLGHFGKPEDIAKTVAFLASDDAAYITGQVIQVDGGMVI